MAHLVKCAVCGEQFDRDKIQAVKHGARRYAHYTCKPDGELVPLAEQKDPDLVQLEEYIKKLLNDTYVHPRVRKQINEYKEQYNYSFQATHQAYHLHETIDKFLAEPFHHLHLPDKDCLRYHMNIQRLPNHY